MNAGPSTSLLDNMHQLVVAGLGCVRGDRLLFRDLQFALEPGQAGLITGPNGVGKSSLLRLIAGLLKPAAGSFETSATIALCDDRLALDEERTLAEALRFWAACDGRSAEDTRAAMAATGLTALAEIPVRLFSTGQRQRARLARTMLSGARLWLLDEPANGLDTASVALIGEMLKNHLQEGGIILAASHIPLPLNFDLELDLSTHAPKDQLA